jgi:CRP-like cAMP-binding protein
LLHNVWLFEQCNARELSELDGAMTELDVPDGRVLARQGDVGREFVVIVDGKAEVTRNGTTIAVLGSGDFFGEMSLLDHQPRTATVTTVAPARILVMTVASFNSLIATMPSVDRKMLAVLAHRLREVEARFVPPQERRSTADIG